MCFVLGQSAYIHITGISLLIAFYYSSQVQHILNGKQDPLPAQRL